MSEKIYPCIQVAQTAKLDCLKQQQQTLSINWSELRFQWEPCLQAKIWQVILFPIIYPSLLVYLVLSYQFQKVKLGSNIRHHQKPFDPSKVNLIDSSIYGLWKQHGLDKTYPDADRLWVLEQWIEILYPEQKNNFILKKQQLENQLKHYKNGQQPLIDEINHWVKQLDLDDFN